MLSVLKKEKFYGGTNMKKLLIKIASACLMLTIIFSFAACTPKNTDAKHLLMWAGGQWTGTDAANLREFVSKYNENNTLGLEIKLDIKSDMETAFATALTSGKSPDLMIWDRFNTPTYATQDFLHEVTDRIDADNVDTTKYHPEAMRELTYNDEIYGLPLDLDVWGIYVNMDMVSAYNTKNPTSAITLNADWTWNDVLEIGKKLTQKNANNSIRVAGYSALDMHEHYFKFMTSTGTSMINGGKVNFDNNASRETLKYFKRLKDANICDGGLTEKNAFTSGLLAMTNNQTYYSDFIEKNAPNMNYKFMPQPRYCLEDGTIPEGSVNGGMIGGFGIAFPKPLERYQTDLWKQKFDNAWAFAKDWLANEERCLEWAQMSNTLPALTSLHQDEFVQGSDILAAAASYVPSYKIRPQVPGFLLLQTQVFNQDIPEYIAGTKSLEDTIKILQANGQRELDDNQ